ncbi:accessory factor UbiK family protein [Chitinimonas sp. BJB300]|uniref:accessory factor UbiK family protein n=1 Tax=Chitinimonas sp. BJB300 TaxID=1559339 RepID=UPI000C0C84E5|nr:accessory factor UbiK family protein [Chitinimonas sp. BJB300]PHV12800.1 phosphoheptose isomerase [Chitinimonas sp. BJB300]TSJ91331.1 accessory factor UbiK family protein [Chitinimonas sp. BJB300]
MLAQRLFDEVNGKIAEVMATGPARDIEKNLRAILSASFAKLDLVTREEFEVQQAVLAKTRETLTALETRVAALEARNATTITTEQNPQDDF